MTSFPLLEIEKGQEFLEKEGSSGEKYKGGWLLQEKKEDCIIRCWKVFSISLHTNACEHFFPHSAALSQDITFTLMCGSDDDIWNSFFSTPLEPANLQFTGHIQAKRLFSITN